jgi:hypothetical protein
MVFGLIVITGRVKYSMGHFFVTFKDGRHRRLVMGTLALEVKVIFCYLGVKAQHRLSLLNRWPDNFLRRNAMEGIMRWKFVFDCGASRYPLESTYYGITQIFKQ